MKNLYVATLAVLFSLAAFPAICLAQGTVMENLETQTISVDPVNGVDTCGANLSICKTINEAVSVAISNNQAGLGTKVNIVAGTYRESVTMNASVMDTSLPMTFQAVTNGTVILSGADLFTNSWTTYSGNHNIYQTTWPYSFGGCVSPAGCPTAPAIALSNNMLVVDGVVMNEVLALSQMIAPNLFYVDQAHTTVYLWPPTSVNPNTAKVEVPTRSSLWNIQGKSNIVLRGLTFQYGNSCRSNSAVTVQGSGTNVILDTDLFQWNNGQGLAITIDNVTIENSTANHNGDSGFQYNQTKNLLWMNDTASYNNWRGAEGAYYACNVGGVHAFLAHEDTINGMTLAFNQSYGIHYDTDAYNASVTNLVSTNNLLSGVFLEKDEGPVTITSSHLCNSNSSAAAGGLAIRNSTNVSLTNSTLANNLPGEIVVFGLPGGISVTNWETLTNYLLISQKFTNTGNVIQGDSAADELFQDTYLTGADWTPFGATLISDNNTWWNAFNNLTEFIVPTPTANNQLDFPQWQSTTGQDANSVFQQPSVDPALACNSVTPDAPDIATTVDTSTPSVGATGVATFNDTITPILSPGNTTIAYDGVSEVPGLSITLTPSSGTPPFTSAIKVTAASSTVAGTYPITLVASSAATTRVVQVALTVPLTHLRYSVVQLNFPNTESGKTSAGMSFTITNTGTTSITLTSFTYDLPTVFKTSTSTCGATLGAGRVCTVTVTFTPNAAQYFSGTLTVVDSDPTTAQVVTLTGTGTHIPTASFSPASLSYGAVGLGSSATLTTTFTNTSTNGANLNIGTISIGGGTFFHDYSQTNTCPTNPPVLTPGANCVFTIKFTPTAATVESGASLSVTSNDSLGVNTVSLTGSGAYPTISFTPTKLAFGTVGVGNGNSSTMTDTVKNTSTNGGVITITTLTLTSNLHNDYTITSTTCTNATLLVNQTCTATIKFTPTVYTTDNATLQINDNLSGGKSTLSLTGKGANPSAKVSPATESFGNQAHGTTSAAKTVTLTNSSTNNATLTVTTITFTGTNKTDFATTNDLCTGVTLLQNQTCTVGVTFTPGATGSRSGTMTFNDNTSTGTQAVSLTGTGT